MCFPDEEDWLMKTRVISAIVMFAILIPSMLTPITRVLLVLLCGVLGTYEMHRVCKKTESPYPVGVIYSLLVFNAIICITGADKRWSLYLFIMALFVMFCLCICEQRFAAKGAMAGLFALCYPAALFCCIMHIINCERWGVVMGIAAFSTWLCDAFAMFGGMLFGKHKMCPVVSPKKTWEGTLCGAAFSLLGGVIVRLIWKDKSPALWICLCVSLIASSLGQFGDLAASLIKRYADVKDYSKLIPGHGGIMDRVDSLLFSVPTAYFLLVLAEETGLW